MPLSESSNHYIDAHVHLWTDDFSRYPLAPQYKPADLAIRRFLAEDILVEARRNDVDRVVLVQMSYYGFDNRLMLDAICHRPETFRGIAIVDANASDPSSSMQAMARQGARGFRVAVTDRGATLAGQIHLEKMFTCGALNNLAICFLLGPQLLRDVARLCERYPDTPVVLDHLARIGMSSPISNQDVDSLCRLARHPRTMVKLSGFYALGDNHPPHHELAPLIRSVYDAFGPQRLMWGSDSPFQTMQEKYSDSISLVRDGLPFLSTGDKDWILRTTAESFFFG